MKMTRSVFAFLLTVILLLSMQTAASAAEETKAVRLTVLSANVSGLPIPSVFSEDGKVVPKTQPILGGLLNESGADIVCVQEDFQFHNLLAGEMKSYPYSTFTTGGIPVGSGLNIFSKYPIYNVEQVPWEKANGILEAGADALTPKGFLKCTVDVQGVLLDVYDIHVDAYGSYEDCLAKKAQFIQLCTYIDKYSAGRPVAITGDMNVTLHSDIPSEFYPIMIQSAGFSDGWAEFCNGGIYFTGALSEEQTAFYNEKWGGYYWGKWDSVERLLYRDTDGVKISATDFRYENYNDLAGQILTDHSMMIGELTLETTDYMRPETELQAPQKQPFAQRFVHAVKMVLRSLSLIFSDLLAKAAAALS